MTRVRRSLYKGITIMELVDMMPDEAATRKWIDVVVMFREWVHLRALRQFGRVMRSTGKQCSTDAMHARSTAAPRPARQSNLLICLDEFGVGPFISNPPFQKRVQHETALRTWCALSDSLVHVTVYSRGTECRLPPLCAGPTAVEETYVGGLERNMHSWMRVDRGRGRSGSLRGYERNEVWNC